MLGRLFPKYISKIEWRKDVHFADKNLVQSGLKKTGSLREKRDKALTIPLAYPWQ